MLNRVNCQQQSNPQRRMQIYYLPEKNAPWQPLPGRRRVVTDGPPVWPDAPWRPASVVLFTLTIIQLLLKRKLPN